MKKIKFRGKDNHGEWRYGSLVYSKNIQPAIYFEKDGELDWVYVDPNTVGQLINGTYSNVGDIYEGDILKITDADNDDTWITKVGTDGEILIHGQDFDYTSLSCVYDLQYEVIGNVYDNPELLKP